MESDLKINVEVVSEADRENTPAYISDSISVAGMLFISCGRSIRFVIVA